jgi:hypothetical protein
MMLIGMDCFFPCVKFGQFNTLRFLWVGREAHVRFEAVSASEEMKVLPVKYVSMILSACSIQPAGNFSLQRNLHEPR